MLLQTCIDLHFGVLVRIPSKTEEVGEVPQRKRCEFPGWSVAMHNHHQTPMPVVDCRCQQDRPSIKAWPIRVALRKHATTSPSRRAEGAWLPCSADVLR
jgi:hypothetical protein